MLTTIAITAAIALALGIGGTLGVQAMGRDDTAPAIVAVAGTVEAAIKPEATDADTRQAIATAPAVNLAVEAAVKPGATSSTVALAAYALCIAGAQGKGEGSAAFGCVDRGRTLDGLLEQP